MGCVHKKIFNASLVKTTCLGTIAYDALMRHSYNDNGAAYGLKDKENLFTGCVHEKTLNVW